MSFINYAAREITCKLVYYGPGLSGKTTNLRHIHARTRAERRGKLVSLETESERTLYFDFFPLTLGRVGAFSVRFHLYTVPGQCFYGAARKLIMRNADGFVFIADSQAQRMEANIESLEDLYMHLEDNNMHQLGLPLVLQCNKRDVCDPLPIEEMRANLGLEAVPTYKAVAAKGIGVFETLEGLGREVLGQLRHKTRSARLGARVSKATSS